MIIQVACVDESICGLVAVLPPPPLPNKQESYSCYHIVEFFFGRGEESGKRGSVVVFDNPGGIPKDTERGRPLWGIPKEILKDPERGWSSWGIPKEILKDTERGWPLWGIQTGTRKDSEREPPWLDIQMEILKGT